MKKEIIITLNQQYIERLCAREVLKLSEVEQNLMRSSPTTFSEPSALQCNVIIDNGEAKAVIINRYD